MTSSSVWTASPILTIFYNIVHYIVLNISSTIILCQFRSDITCGDLITFFIFRYLNFFGSFMKCYVVGSSRAYFLLIMIILIISSYYFSRIVTFGTDWSTTLHAYSKLYPSGTLILIGAFAAEIWYLILDQQMLLAFDLNYLLSEDHINDNSIHIAYFSTVYSIPQMLEKLTYIPNHLWETYLCVLW